jgi:uncharacterized membrane protein YeaQ/YmgE (transglycosylase-associated protein family)
MALALAAGVYRCAEKQHDNHQDHVEHSDECLLFQRTAGLIPTLSGDKPVSQFQRRLVKGVPVGIIAFIVLGLLAGIIAKAVLPGEDPGGFIVTAIIGIVGALLGGFLAAAIFGAHPLDEFFDISTWLTAIIGSIILLVIYRMVTNRSGHGVRA